MRFIFFLLFFLMLSTPYAAHAAAPGQETTHEVILTEKARVTAVENIEVKTIPGTDTTVTYQTLKARILSGADAGATVVVQNDYLALKTGEVFFLTHTLNPGEGIDTYNVLEPDRLPALAILLGLFVIAVLIVGGWTGLRGLVALGISILLVFYALLPGIASGYDPLVVAAGVAGLIVVLGSYLTHGINRTTSAAVVGLITTIAVTALIAHFAVAATRLSGFADESAVYLNFATQGHIDFLGLLLAAMLIGALGILYDAAIGQAVAVEELLRAMPHMPLSQLFARAMRIGREHIGALVNTLAIAYVGVALPLLLLFRSYGEESFLQTINHEMFATEIVRAIVGSLGIVLAVPLATLAAIFLLSRRPPVGPAADHGHHH